MKRLFDILMPAIAIGACLSVAGCGHPWPVEAPGALGAYDQYEAGCHEALLDFEGSLHISPVDGLGTKTRSLECSCIRCANTAGARK